MRAKSLALLSLALGCGLVASIGITQVMAKRSAPDLPVGETENIYVAVRDIPLNEVLNTHLLKLEQWPKDKVPPGAITKLEEIEGHRCRTRLYAGEAILKNKLFSRGQGDFGGTSSQIPKGMRVVPVRVDAVSGAGGLILPGDRVDILVHLRPDPAAGIHEPTTRTVLQNIKVFAADAVTDLERSDSGDGKSIQAKTISLLVTPEQAEKVMLAAELGNLRLVMRSPEDDTPSNAQGVTARELFGRPDSGQLAKDQAPLDQGKSTASADFLEMLKATAQPKQAATVEPKKAEASPAPTAPIRYRMILLLGTKRGEAVFEPQGKAAVSQSWKLITEDGGPATDLAQVPAVPQTIPAAEQPPKAEEGKNSPKPDPNNDKPGGKATKPSPAGTKDKPQTKTS